VSSIKYTDSDLYNQLLLCSSQFYNLKHARTLGTQSNESNNISLSKITNNLLTVLDNIYHENFQLSESNPKHKVRLLLVDDSQADNFFHQHVIDNSQLDSIEIVGVAVRPPDAIRLIYEKRPDVVLLDITMPVMSGWDVLDFFGELFFHVVILTSSYNPKEVEKAMLYSGVDFMTKPLTEEGLKMIVNKYYDSIADNHIKYRTFKDSIKNKGLKITLESQNGLLPVPEEQIVLIERKDENTYIRLDNHTVIHASKDLQHFDNILDKDIFIKVNDKTIVNKTKIVGTNEDNKSINFSNHTLKLTNQEFELFSNILGGKLQVTEIQELLQKDALLNLTAKRFDYHLFKNILNSILFLIEKREIELSKEIVLNAISFFHSLDYEDNNSALCPLEKELSLVKSYLEIENIRFENGIKYKIFIDDSIKNKLLVPKMLIHTFVNNSVKHSRLGEKTPLTIKIIVEKFDNYSLIEVIDNGKGSPVNNYSGKGGLSILQKTIEVINSKLFGKIEFQIRNIKNENGNPVGAKASIRIPDDLIV